MLMRPNFDRIMVEYVVVQIAKGRDLTAAACPEDVAHPSLQRIVHGTSKEPAQTLQ